MTTRNKDNTLKGISGWMVIPILGMSMTIALQLFDALDTLMFYDIYLYADVLTTNVLLIVLASASLFCIFKKLKLGKYLSIAYFVVVIVINTYTYSYLGAIFGVLWLAYFLFSKRVSNTLEN